VKFWELTPAHPPITTKGGGGEEKKKRKKKRGKKCEGRTDLHNTTLRPQKKGKREGKKKTEKIT